MAEYYIDDYAIGSSGFPGSGTVGATLQGQWRNDIVSFLANERIQITFPTLSVMNKKQCSDVSAPYIYVTEKYSLLTPPFSGWGTPIADPPYAELTVKGYNSEIIGRTTREIVPSERSIAYLNTNSYNCIPTEYTGGRIGISTILVGYAVMDTTYFFNIGLAISDHLSANKPYRRVTFSDINPYATNRFPNKFVDKKVENTFSWSFSASLPSTGIPLTQKSAKFRYRNLGDTEYTEIAIDGNQNSYTLPANTFTTDAIQWQSIVTSDDDIESTQADWVSVTTIDSIPTVTISYPVNVYIDGTQNNTVAWNYIIDTNSLQTKFDVEYKNSSGVWTSIVTETTANYYATIPANTLQSGNVQYRVRAYNTDSVASEWAYANILVKSAPPTPFIISITNSAMPKIEWQSSEQQAYRIAIIDGENVVFETESIASTLKSHTVDDYIADGTYTAKLYVTNSYNLESIPAETQFTISTVKPAAPTVTAEKITNGVKLIISNGTSIMYVLRNGVPVAKLENATNYYDFSANGSNTYVVRAIDLSSYADSTPVTVITSVGHATLAVAVKPSNMFELIYNNLGGEIVKSGNISVSGTGMFFAGREQQVFEFDSHSVETRTFSYAVMTNSEFTQLQTLIKQRQTLLFRNAAGECFYGIIKGLEFSIESTIIKFTFDIQKVDYVEKIAYEVM